MCNLYSMTKNQDAIRRLFNFDTDSAGNLPAMPGIFPDKMAPIVRNNGDERELSMVRGGMPTPQSELLKAAKKRAAKLDAKGKQYDFNELLRMEPDGGVTNIRNLKSKHWTRWSGVEHRCIVPFTSFSEFNANYGGNVWFALDESRPLTCFAGLWLPGWTSVRKIKEGETTNDLFGFLTTDANDFMKPIHGKAMPVILTRKSRHGCARHGTKPRNCSARCQTAASESWQRDHRNTMVTLPMKYVDPRPSKAECRSENGTAPS